VIGGNVIKNILLAVIAATVIAGGILYFQGGGRSFTSLESGIPEYPGSAAEADSFSVRLPGAQKRKPVKAVI